MKEKTAMLFLCLNTPRDIKLTEQVRTLIKLIETPDLRNTCIELSYN